MKLKIKTLRSLQLRRGFGTIKIRNPRLLLLKFLVTYADSVTCKLVFWRFDWSVSVVFLNLMFSCSNDMGFFGGGFLLILLCKFDKYLSYFIA